MRLVRHKFERDGEVNKLTLFPVPSQFFDKLGKEQTISPRFSWHPTCFVAKRHPLQTVVHRSSGVISHQLESKKFGHKLVGFGTLDNFNEIKYKQSAWKREKDNSTLTFEGRGFEIRVALVGLGFKQVIKVTDKSLLDGCLIERLYINHADCQTNRSNRVVSIIDGKTEEASYSKIHLMENGIDTGAILPGVIYNDEHTLPLQHTLVEQNNQVFLLIQIPEEVKSWEGPVYIDPSISRGFTKNYGVCVATGSSIFDSQCPNASSHLSAQPALWTNNAGTYESPSIYWNTNTDWRVAYVDLFIPNQYIEPIREAYELTLKPSIGNLDSGHFFEATVLPFTLRPLDGSFFIESSKWRFNRNITSANERTGVSPLLLRTARNYCRTKYQKNESAFFFDPFFFGTGVKIFNANEQSFDSIVRYDKKGGRLQEIFNDILNSDREARFTCLMFPKQDSLTYDFRLFEATSTPSLSVTISWKNLLNESGYEPNAKGWNSAPIGEPKISFVDDDTEIGKLYSSMGVSVRDMMNGNELDGPADGGNTNSIRDPYKLDQRMNVRDDYSYFDGHHKPFNHVPNACFRRALNGPYSHHVTVGTSNADLPFRNHLALNKNRLDLTTSSTSSQQTSSTMYNDETNANLSVSAFAAYMIPLHNLDFNNPYLMQLWAKADQANDWKAAIVFGWNFEQGKWQGRRLVNSSGQEIGQSTSWGYFRADFAPKYTAPFQFARPSANIISGTANHRQLRSWRTFPFHSSNFGSVNGFTSNWNPYSCFLLFYHSTATNARGVHIFAPSLIRSYNGLLDFLPTDIDPEAIEFDAGTDEYVNSIAAKQEVFHVSMRNNVYTNQVVNNVTPNSVAMNNTNSLNRLPYVGAGVNFQAYFSRLNNNYLSYDMPEEVLDEGSIEFWYAPTAYYNSFGGILGKLPKFHENNIHVFPTSEINHSHQDATTSAIFDTNPNHIFSLGNLKRVGSNGYVALSGAGMSLVRSGNSLVWMIREQAFTWNHYEADLQGPSNGLDCTRANDKMFYKCQFDIPESMITGSTSVLLNGVDQSSWMKIKLVWGPRMEMYVNGELIDINPHVGFTNLGAMVQSSGTNWNNSVTGRMNKLVFGNIEFSYRTNHDLNNNLLYNSYFSDRGFFRTLQSDECAIQDFGISNKAQSSVFSASRVENTGVVGQVDNNELVTSGVITNVSIGDRAIQLKRRQIGGLAYYEVEDRYIDQFDYDDIEGYIETSAMTLYVRGTRTNQGKTLFSPYYTNTWKPNGIRVAAGDSEFGVTLPDGTITSANWQVPTFTYNNYVPNSTKLFMQDSFGRQAAISSISNVSSVRDVSAFHTQTYSVERLTADVFYIYSAFNSTYQKNNVMNGKYVGIDGAFYIIRDWQVLRNGYVIARVASALANFTQGSRSLSFYNGTHSYTFQALSNKVVYKNYNQRTDAITDVNGNSIRIFSCDLFDKGFYNIETHTAESWATNDKLKLKNPYPEPAGGPYLDNNCRVWFDGLWHVVVNTASDFGVRLSCNTTQGGSLTLVENRASGVVQDNVNSDIQSWIIKLGGHAVFKPTNRPNFKITKWSSSSSFYSTALSVLQSTKSYALPSITVDPTLRLDVRFEDSTAKSYLPSLLTPTAFNITPTVINGVHGKALQLAGSNGGQQQSCYQYGTTVLPDLTDFTIGFWFNKDNGTQSSSFFDPVAWVQSRTGFAANEAGIGISTYQDGGCNLSIGDGVNMPSQFAFNRISEGGPNINDSQWHHICVVVDRVAKTAKTYLDSVLRNTLDISLVTGNINVGATTGHVGGRRPFCVGGTNWANNESFRGGMDQLFVFGRTLTLSEIQQLANINDPRPSFATNYDRDENAVYFSTPNVITKCHDSKSAITFQPTLTEPINLLTRDIPNETDKWIVEGRSSELGAGATGRNSLIEYGDFSVIIDAQNSSPFDTYEPTGFKTYRPDAVNSWLAYRPLFSYVVENSRGIGMEFFASEKYAGIPLAGGHYTPHLMPLFTVLNGLESTWSGATEPDAGSFVVMRNANRWCRFPFHYKSIKNMYAYSGDDITNARAIRFYGHTRQVDAGCYKVQVRVAGGRWLQADIPNRIDSDREEKWHRAAVVGEPVFLKLNGRSTKILDPTSMSSFSGNEQFLRFDTCPQMWFDGRNFHLKHHGAREPRFMTFNAQGAYLAPIGSFMFRAIYGGYYNLLQSGGANSFGDQPYNITAPVILDDGYNTIPSAGNLVAPVVREQLGWHMVGGWMNRFCLIYPNMGAAGESITRKEFKAGVGGAGFNFTSNPESQNFENRGYDTATTLAWQHMLGHIRFRVEDDGIYSNQSDYIRFIAIFKPRMAQILNTTREFLIGHEALQLNVFNQAGFTSDIQSATIGGTTQIIVPTPTSTLDPSLHRWCNKYAPGDATEEQAWLARVAQPMNFVVQWDFVNDISNLNARRVKMIGMAFSGRRHMSMDTQAPIWAYPCDADRARDLGIYADEKLGKYSPRSALLRKADEEHLLRYPEDFDRAATRFNRNRVMGDFISAYVLRDGGVYARNINTASVAVLADAELLCLNDTGLTDPSKNDMNYEYKTVAQGQTRDFRIKIINNGTAPATIEIGDAALVLRNTAGRINPVDLLNTNSVTIQPNGGFGILRFQSYTIPAATPVGEIMADVDVVYDDDNTAEFTITGTKGMYCQLTPTNRLVLYNNADPRHRVCMIGGDTWDGVQKYDDLRGSQYFTYNDGTHHAHDVHFYNEGVGNFLQFSGQNSSLQARVTKGHPNARWDIRIAKQFDTLISGTTYPQIADLDFVLMSDAISKLEASYGGAATTTYPIFDILNVEVVNNEPDSSHASRIGQTRTLPEECRLNTSSEFMRIAAYDQNNAKSHLGTTLKIILRTWVNGSLETHSATLTTLTEQDAPTLTLSAMTCDKDEDPGVDILTKDNQDMSFFVAMNTSAGSKPAIKLDAQFLVYRVVPFVGNLYEWAVPGNSPTVNRVGAGDTHVYGLRFGETNHTGNYINPGQAFTWRFDGFFPDIATEQEQFIRSWKIKILPHADDPIKNRDKNGCPLLLTELQREFTSTPPAIYLLGKPVIQGVSMAQRSSDMAGDGKLYFNSTADNTLGAAGCMRLQFDVKVPTGGADVPVEFLIAIDKVVSGTPQTWYWRPYIRYHGEVSGVAKDGASNITAYNSSSNPNGMYNGTTFGGWSPTIRDKGRYNAAGGSFYPDPEGEFKAHFIATAGNTLKTFVLDIDLRHLGFWDEEFEGTEGEMIARIQVKRAESGGVAITEATTLNTQYKLKNPDTMIVSVNNGVTWNYTQPQVNITNYDLLNGVFSIGNKMTLADGGLQYSFGNQTGGGNRSWTKIASVPSTFNLANTGWNSVMFRALDKFANFQTYQLGRPYDNNVAPVLNSGSYSGFKLLPQYNNTNLYHLDIHSGDSVAYIHLPPYSDKTPMNWLLNYKINNGGNVISQWSPPTMIQNGDGTYRASYAANPISKHAYASNYTAAWVNCYDFFQQQSSTTPAGNTNGFHVVNVAFGSETTGQLEVDAVNGLQVFHGWTNITGFGEYHDRLIIRNDSDILEGGRRWGIRNNSYVVNSQWCDYLHFSMRLTSGAGRRFAAGAQPTWKCRVQWQNTGDATLYSKDIYVWDDNMWHSYVVDMTGVTGWRGGTNNSKDFIQIVFGASQVDDGDVTYWEYEIGNGDTNPYQSRFKLDAYIANMGVAQRADLIEFYTPFTLSSALNGSQSIQIGIQLQDYSPYTTPSVVTYEGPYYILPKKPTGMVIDHKDTTDGLLRIYPKQIITTEAASTVLYQVAFYTTNPAVLTYLDNGNVHTKAEWESGTYTLVADEGMTYYFQCRGRNPVDPDTLRFTQWSDPTEFFSDFLFPQVQWCSHYTESTQNYITRDNTSVGETVSPIWRNISTRQAIGQNMINGKSVDVDWWNGRAFKSDWNDGFYSGLLPSTNLTVSINLRNFRTGCTNVIQGSNPLSQDPGIFMNQHPVDGFFYLVTYGPSTRLTQVNQFNFTGFKTAAQKDTSYHVIQLVHTFNPKANLPVFPPGHPNAGQFNGDYSNLVAYLHVVPYYDFSGNKFAFGAQFAAHFAFYFDFTDALYPHPVPTFISHAEADGIQVPWNDASLPAAFNNPIYKIKADISPVMGVSVPAYERPQFHAYRLIAQDFNNVSVTGVYDKFAQYVGGNINQKYEYSVGGLAEHKRYRLKYSVKSSSGVEGPVGAQFSAPVFSSLRPAGPLLNVFPSGQYTVFKWNGLAGEMGDYHPTEIGLSGVAGYYEVHDWMNGESVATIPFSGLAQYQYPAILQGGVQSGYVLKAYNNNRVTLKEFNDTTGLHWDETPVKRSYYDTPGWKAEVYDYLTFPQVTDMAIGVGYNAGTNSKYLKPIPYAGTNQDAVDKRLWWNPRDFGNHRLLNINIKGNTFETKFHLQTQYIVKVYKRPKNDPNTIIYLGVLGSSNVPVLNPGALIDTYWKNYTQMRAATYRMIGEDLTGFFDPNYEYGFSMRARALSTVASDQDIDRDDSIYTQHTDNSTLDDPDTWTPQYTMSTWSPIKWTDLTAKADDDEYDKLLHVYIRKNQQVNNQTFDLSEVVQDVVPPVGHPEVFRDVRLSYKQIGSETTDLMNYASNVQEWIKGQWELQAGEPVVNNEWGFPAGLYGLPHSTSRLFVEVTFNNNGQPKTIYRAVDLWDSVNRTGFAPETKWGIHDKANFLTIHNDHGTVRFDQYQDEVKTFGKDGWLSTQQTDTWYHLRWNLYDDALRGEDFFINGGSLEGHGKTWADVTNVRFRLGTFAYYASGIYTPIPQFAPSTPEEPDLRWRNDLNYCLELQKGESGLFVRNLSIGWTEQIDILGFKAYDGNPWNGKYEWHVQPINLIHNPALDVYESQLSDSQRLPMSKPKDFVAKKTLPQAPQPYNYDDYVKEVMED